MEVGFSFLPSYPVHSLRIMGSLEQEQGYELELKLEEMDV